MFGAAATDVKGVPGRGRPSALAWSVRLQCLSQGANQPVRIARFSIDGNVAFGAVEGDKPDELVLDIIKGIPFTEHELSGTKVPLSKVRLLPPVLPSKIVAFGRNYAEHARELGNEVPDAPFAFFKPSTSVVGPGDDIQYPSFSEDLHHEAELAVVIGRMCREVPRDRVKDVIFGYTCANDITARDVQKREKQWARAKGFDSACPLGPWVETDLDPADLTVQLTVNGQQRQLGRTSEMIHSIEDLIVNITEAMTLLPGDVILTGTPAGVGPLAVGDEVSVSIEGIGTLTNKVVKRG
ncbi:2-keto-4-pentenoate hydratase/2-oxohepta-3-ene-1,7-dioic acid hydratase in catechol pathway [Streptomyces phaeoluteigriseus]